MEDYVFILLKTLIVGASLVLFVMVARARQKKFALVDMTGLYYLALDYFVFSVVQLVPGAVVETWAPGGGEVVLAWSLALRAHALVVLIGYVYVLTRHGDK